MPIVRDVPLNQIVYGMGTSVNVSGDLLTLVHNVDKLIRQTPILPQIQPSCVLSGRFLKLPNRNVSSAVMGA